jgi:hypothetical protein
MEWFQRGNSQADRLVPSPAKGYSHRLRLTLSSCKRAYARSDRSNFLLKHNDRFENVWPASMIQAIGGLKSPCRSGTVCRTRWFYAWRRPEFHGCRHPVPISVALLVIPHPPEKGFTSACLTQELMQGERLLAG